MQVLLIGPCVFPVGSAQTCMRPTIIIIIIIRAGND